jgi:hypothetical protein
MSEPEITTCEFIKEVESAAREARRKGGDDPSGPLAMAYYALSLEMRKLVHRHITRGQCSACREDENRSQAGNRPSMNLTYRDHSRHANAMGVTQ